MNDLDFDPIPDPPAGSLPAPSHDLDVPPDAVLAFHADASKVRSLDAAVRLWLAWRERLVALGGTHATGCQKSLASYLAEALRTTFDAADRVFLRALGRVDPAAVPPSPPAPPPPAPEDGWWITAVGTLDEVRQETVVDRNGDLEVQVPVVHLTVRARGIDGTRRVRRFWIVCDQEKYRRRLTAGARVWVNLTRNHRYRGTRCSVWRYLLVHLTPVGAAA